jgi:dihydrodipicolinate synthase/N-acetylneuraminate lyase
MDTKEKYGGVVVPMVSPLNRDLSVDVGAVKCIIDAFIASRVKPFILGTTGEGVSLSADQKSTLVRATVSAVGGKETVMAGIMGNSLPEAVEAAQRYAGYGVDGVVATVPNYYPSDASQMRKYFTRLADAVHGPLMLYNIPGTVHHSIPIEVIEELSHHPKIIGVKDSEHDRKRLDASLERWKERDDFVFLVGWASRSVYGLVNGAAGIVPSTANFVPLLYRRLFDAVKTNKLREANEMQEKTDRISEWCQAGRDLSRSIAALKQIMAMKNLCQEYVMPPICEMNGAEKEAFGEKIKTGLQQLNV